MSKSRVWYGVVLHHAASSRYATFEQIEAGHKRKGYRAIGYHYYWQRDPATDKLHLKAGRSTQYQGVHGSRHHNKNCLGVCVFGNYDEQKLLPGDYGVILAGLQQVFDKHSIGCDKLLPHRAIKATACPGKNMPVSALQHDLAKL